MRFKNVLRIRLISHKFSIGDRFGKNSGIRHSNHRNTHQTTQVRSLFFIQKTVFCINAWILLLIIIIINCYY